MTVFDERVGLGGWDDPDEDRAQLAEQYARDDRVAEFCPAHDLVLPSGAALRFSPPRAARFGARRQPKTLVATDQQHRGSDG